MPVMEGFSVKSELQPNGLSDSLHSTGVAKVNTESGSDSGAVNLYPTDIELNLESGSPSIKTHSGEGRRKKMISMAMKQEIINKYEEGARIVNIAKEYGRNQSTIGTIIKNRKAIKASKASKGTTILASQRTSINDEMERLLLLWIKEKEIAGDTINQPVISHKAMALFDDLVEAQRNGEDEGSAQKTPPNFKASHGWYERFKRRTGIRPAIRHEEAASSAKKEVDNFVKKFGKLISDEGYMPQQVFNCDETGLFWKKMPHHTSITAKEQKISDHKSMNERLTLAFCANASGDLKIRPLLVCHSKNSSAFKALNIRKGRLSVFRKSNRKVMVTKTIFIEWVNVCFGPAVKKYLEKNDLPLKCLLVLDNAPAHPPDLEDSIHVDFSFIKVLYLPSNTTPPLQPMEQQVIANFKKFYKKYLFRKCLEVTKSTQLTRDVFLKEHFHIVQGLKMIEKAWNEVSKHTLKSSWKKLWPGVETKQDPKGSEKEHIVDSAHEGGVEDIISLGRSVGIVVEEAHVDNFTKELTTGGFRELKTMQVTIIQEEQQLSGGEKVGEAEETSSAEIREAIGWYENLTRFIEKNHPEKIHTSRLMDSVNNICMSHFRNILRSCQEQTTLDRYFFKRKVSKSADDKSKSSKKAKESEPEEVLL
ncbi:tigger transposable element-derived protein 1-like [Watersipora subatra]|uniref:tigger transposable element-derived protein 1-like n=1 Tax=Watersipora subatra TaxID=2589382 RepID=UPI00355AD775